MKNLIDLHLKLYVYLLSLGMKNVLHKIQKIQNVWSPSNNRCSCGYLNSLQPLFIEAI